MGITSVDKFSTSEEFSDELESMLNDEFSKGPSADLQSRLVMQPGLRILTDFVVEASQGVSGGFLRTTRYRTSTTAQVRILDSSQAILNWLPKQAGDYPGASTAISIWLR